MTAVVENAVEKMDGLGRGAWIALMVVSFILVWPIGLAVLAFLLWSGRMGCNRMDGAGGERGWAGFRGGMGRWSCGGGRRDRAQAAFRPTGNRAFDEYREETLKRLEEEASEFTSFLERLRQAKDKAEFEQFMTERRNRPAGPSEDIPPART